MTNVTDEQLGKLARQQADLFRRVREGSLDPASVTRGLQEVIAGKYKTVLEPFSSIEVQYWYDLRISLELLGYEHVHNQITRNNFPVRRLGWSLIQPRLLCFGRRITHEELVVEADKRGLRLAVIEEFIAFLRSHPHILKDTEIVAAGSIWEIQGESIPRFVPTAYISGLGRTLYLHPVELNYHSKQHFLVVEK